MPALTVNHTEVLLPASPKSKSFSPCQERELKNTFRHCSSQENNTKPRAIHYSTEHGLKKLFPLAGSCSLTAVRGSTAHSTLKYCCNSPHSPLEVVIAPEEASQSRTMQTNQPPNPPRSQAWFSEQLSTQDSRWNPQSLSCLKIRPYVTVKCPDWYFLISSLTPAPLALSAPCLRSSSDFWASESIWQRIQTTVKCNSRDRPASSVSESEIMVYNNLIRQISYHMSLVLYASIHESSVQ